MVCVLIFLGAETMVAYDNTKYEKFIPLTTNEVCDLEDKRKKRFHYSEEYNRRITHSLNKTIFMKRPRPSELLEGILYDLDYLYNSNMPKKKTYFFDIDDEQYSKNYQGFFI